MKGPTMDRTRTALLSVYNKAGIVAFAQQLKELRWDILASGGTAKALSEAGIEVRDVAELVGAAILGHRVVTLSREVHAGLLARGENQDDLNELEALGIPYIDLICVDLYPLQEEIARDGATVQTVIEKTDVGGPTLLHSAAKGQRIVVCDPIDRQIVIDWLRNGEPDREEFIQKFAAKAEALVAEYVLASAVYHGEGEYAGMVGKRVAVSKYGENPQQKPAALYSVHNNDPLAISNFRVIAGTDPSFNNLADLDRLLQTTTHIAAVYDVNHGRVPYIAVAVKHGNPCGAAVGEDMIKVLQRTVMGDPRAIFGGVVMTNFPIGEAEAEVLLSHGMKGGKRRLLDGIIAPRFEDDAIRMLTRRGDRCRFIVNPALKSLDRSSLDYAPRFRYVRGGFLQQPNYTTVMRFSSSDLVRVVKGNLQQEYDMLFAWAIGSTSNSNTITLVRDGMLIGNGVGQQDRVGAAELAIKRANNAGHSTAGAAAYSDSFFPFLDAVHLLVEMQVSAILTSSGSIRDKEVMEFCQQTATALYMVPDTTARGFFGH